MTIQIERLHPAEWDLLKGIDDGYSPDPDRSIAIVARNSGPQLIARLFAIAPFHVEGIHIEPAWRGSSLFKDMMSAMEMEARSEGIKRLFAYSVRPEIGHYLERRCDYSSLPWRVYMKELIHA